MSSILQKELILQPGDLFIADSSLLHAGGEAKTTLDAPHKLNDETEGYDLIFFHLI